LLLKIKKIFINIIFPIIVAFFNIIIIFYPQEIIKASQIGLSLWANNVLPSLLPFVFGINILMALGVTNFIGTLLEPVMLPLFGVSGIGAFPLVCGMTSGYPMGAKIISDLRFKHSVNKSHAQKILLFTNNCGPLFILGAVSSTMFNNLKFGYYILICHYISAITLGILTRNLFKSSQNEIVPTTNKNILRQAYKSMLSVRNKEKRNIPQIFADSVKNSIETILTVGGYIVLFSVITKILEITNVITYIGYFFTKFTSLSINEILLQGIFAGIIEMTNGLNILKENGISLVNALAVLFVISFGGLSVHLQSINFIVKTDLNIFMYLAAKLFQGLIAVLLGFVLYPFFNFETVSVFLNIDNSFGARLFFSSKVFLMMILINFGVVFFGYLFYSVVKKIRI